METLRNAYLKPMQRIQEVANYIGGNLRSKTYLNTYNLGWRNHPNLSYANNKANPPPGFQPVPKQQQAAPTPPSQLEETLQNFIIATQAAIQSKSNSISSLQLHMRNLENQMGQLAKFFNSRPPVTLPSDSDINSRGQGSEHIKAIEVRNRNHQEIKSEQCLTL